MPEGHLSQLAKIKNSKKKIDRPESFLGKAKWTQNHNT